MLKNDKININIILYYFSKNNKILVKSWLIFSNNVFKLNLSGVLKRKLKKKYLIFFILMNVILKIITDTDFTSKKNFFCSIFLKICNNFYWLESY